MDQKSKTLITFEQLKLGRLYKVGMHGSAGAPYSVVSSEETISYSRIILGNERTNKRLKTMTI